MPTKPLDRLMFAQGGLCFFCKKPLPKSEASVEHLVASANGGNNKDDNCVACCKAVNALLGSMSLKEKIQVVLNQKGQFKCPNGTGTAKNAVQPKATQKAPADTKSKEDKFKLVVANLKQRGDSKPSTIKTLTSTVASILSNASELERNTVIQQLQLTGKVTVSGNKVTYAL